MKPVRIGIDGHVLGKNIGGVERYVAKVVELVPDLRPEYQFIVFVTRKMAAHFAGNSRPNVRFVPLPVSDPLLQRSIVLPWLMRWHGIDLLHIQRITPWLVGPCRILLTIHDLIPLRHPQAYPSFRDRLIRLLTPPSIARADFIVCPTLAVCADVKSAFPKTCMPVQPFYSGVDAERFARGAEPVNTDVLGRYGITEPFLFSPGSIEARRNLETAVEALARIDPARRPMFVISGSIRDAACFARLQALARERGVGDLIRHIGFVSEDDLIDLYYAAAGCVAASFDEGFNLLPLEAMACKAPVICSDIPVHRELFDDAAIFFPPHDPAALADAIDQMLANGRSSGDMPAAAACVQRLSWHAMAARTATIIDTMLKQPS